MDLDVRGRGTHTFCGTKNDLTGEEEKNLNADLSFCHGLLLVVACWVEEVTGLVHKPDLWWSDKLAVEWNRTLIF